ncbi:MAG TPA: hypothetical protein IAA08_02490, partial [Candidatus Eubacterium avistercoris]|nr:hypothetical protein [Candidatus Eubacterium avistercoris]
MKGKKNIRGERRKKGRKMLAAVMTPVLVLAMAAGIFSGGPGQVQAANVSKEADSVTMNDYSSWLGNTESTRYNGRVWSDKSVSTENVTFGDNEVVEIGDSDFLTTYSLLGTSMKVKGQQPTDTVFILDFSTSMTWGYNKDHESVDKKDSRIQALVDSVNDAIDTLVKANPENRIAIAVFNGSSTALLPELTTGSKILEKVPDGNYLEITGYHFEQGKDGGTAEVTCKINDEKAETGSGTNIQAGMFAGMKILADNEDTTYELADGTAVTRIPNVVFMSDGAPTTFASAQDATYTDENNKKQSGSITNSTDLDSNMQVQSGSWWNTSSGEAIGSGDNNNPDSADGFMALLTASYLKNEISQKYYNGTDQANIYTVGFGTTVQTDEMVAMANLVLDPGTYLEKDTNVLAVEEVKSAWKDYLDNGKPVVSAPIGHGNNNTKVRYQVSHPTGKDAKNDPESLIYPTQAFNAENAEELNNIFREIANMITSEAQVPTEITGNDPVRDGYITYEDPIGEYMQVDDVPAVMYFGARFNKKDVQTTTSNGVTTKTYTFEKSDGGTEIESPVYGKGNINHIQITVVEDQDGKQTLKVQVPASAIPLRVNTVTLKADGTVDENKGNRALPLRVLYRVSLKDKVTDENGNINAAALSESYINDNLSEVTEGGQSVKKVNFYANRYNSKTEGSDSRTMGEAFIKFKPASTNPFYFVQENTPLYVNGTEGVLGEDGKLGEPATGSIDPDAMYYFKTSYYEGTNSVTRVIARKGATLEEYAKPTGENNQLELQKGSPRLGNLTDFIAEKETNATGTADTSRYPTFNSQDPGEGEFVVYLGNNGLLQLDAPVSLTIAKEVTTETGVTAPDEEFSFGIKIPDKANTTVEAVKHKADQSEETVCLKFDGEGNGQVVTEKDGEEAYSDIILKAHETLEIPVTVNTGYSVWEKDIPTGFTLTEAQTGSQETGKFDQSEKKVNGTLANEDLTVTFKNEYAASETLEGSSNLKVSKDLEGRKWNSDDSFTFTLTALGGTDANGTPFEASQVPMPSGKTGTQASLSLTKDRPEGAFGNITYTKPGTYKYEITENSESAGGITYSKAVYQVEVTVTDQKDGTLKVDSLMTKVTDDKGDKLEAPAQAVDHVAGFTNTYAPAGTVQITEQDFDLTKVLAGKTWDKNSDAFTFELTAAGGKSSPQLDDYDIDAEDVPMPANREVTVSEPDTEGGSSATFGFGPIEYSKPGIYTYQVRELQGNNGGMTYSKNTATITVTVSDNLNGGYTASVNTENDIFTNQYSTNLDYSAKGGLSIVKKLNGHNMEAFQFLVKPADQVSADKAGIQMSGQTYQNASGASMDQQGTSTEQISVLENMKFTQADAGKTYTYTITEQSGNGAGYRYDDTEYTVNIVTADDGKGVLTVTTEIKGSNGVSESYVYTNVKDSAANRAAVTFTNDYSASGELGGKGDVSISAEKILTGRSMENGEFTFSVTDKNGKEVSRGTNQAAAEGQAGAVDFTAITYTKDSLIKDAASGAAVYSREDGKDIYTYQYTVSEKGDELPAGVSQETGSFMIQVTVTDNNDGTLLTAVSYPQGSGGKLTFRNNYGASARAVLNITGEKVLDVMSGNNAPDISGKYTFTLKGSEGAPMPEQTKAVNDKSGNISFGDVTYTMENVFGTENDEGTGVRTKTFTYTITESGRVPGVDNDKETAKTFKVTVTDRGDGTLDVKTDSTGALFTFTNTYSVTETDPSSPGDSGISITKELTGREMKAGEFHFLMKDEEGNTVAEGSNEGDGTVTLSGISFDRPGTYRYQICEERGTLGGVTYDPETYTAVANVTDNGDGTLRVSWEAADGSNTPVKNLVFRNSYETADVTGVVLGAAKVLDGRELKEGEFTFLLKDGSGNVISTAQNNAAGAIS